MAHKKNLALLSKKLGYTFKDQSLLISALTHRSMPKNNNERLEFLGDSIVNFIAAEIVYSKFEFADEGELSRLRTMLVRGITLASIARELNVGDYLYLGIGEMRSGGSRRESILADALEAIIAAIYLDGGLELCRACVTRWFEPLVASLLTSKVKKDPKTELQEYLQADNIGLPLYEVIDITGKAHEQIFTVKCAIVEIDRAVTGKGTSRRRAEQESAETMLLELIQDKRDV